MSIILRTPSANSAQELKIGSQLTQHKIEHSSIKGEYSQQDSLIGNSQNLITTAGQQLKPPSLVSPLHANPMTTSFISPTVFASQRLKPFTNNENMIDNIQAKPNPLRSNQLRRAACNIKEGKSVLKFSTLYIAKFIRRIKEVSSLMRFKEIGLSQFTIIRDLASDYNYFFMRGAFTGESPSFLDRLGHGIRESFVWQTCQSKFSCWWQLLGTIQLLILPNSLTRLIWISLMFFVLIANLIYVPLRYSFSFVGGYTYQWIFLELPVVTFGIEIFLSFFTAIYQKGLIITDRIIIIKSYLKGRFIWDMVVFTIFMVGIKTNTYTDLIVVVRTYDVFEILREIDERLRFRGRIQNFFELFKLIFFIIIFAHFIACTWHKIGQMGIDDGEPITWMTALYNDSIPDTVFSMYITSFYWSVVTMITLGYGDIVPRNQNERLFVIFITQVSCIIFAYSMNSIGEILREMGRKRAMFNQQMGLMDTYMRKRSLSSLTQVKVRKYFEYLNKESMEDNEQSGRLISSLPQTLKEEVYSDVYGRVLNQKKIFYLHFSTSFLKDLALLMRERRLGPEETLFKEKSASDSLYFVMKGKVQLMLRTGETIKVLGKGDLFSEIQFFSDQLSEFKAVTSNVTSLAVLRKQDFLEAIQNYPNDYEQYCCMRDNLNMYNDIQGLDHQCMSCGSYSHRMKHCQYINYVRNEAKVLNLYTKYPDQKRTFSFRKAPKKFKSLLWQPLVYEGALKTIFAASKSAKAQDLQEELSDMESDSMSLLNQSMTSFHEFENDDVEISRAAISMISSVTPQFTKDFFQRTKIQAIATAATFAGAVTKASKFSRLQKNENQNVQFIRTETIQDDDREIFDSSSSSPENGKQNSQNNSKNINNNNSSSQNNKSVPRKQGSKESAALLDAENRSRSEKELITEDVASLTNENQIPSPQLALFSTEENLLQSDARSSVTSNAPIFSFAKEPRRSFLNMARPFDKRFEDISAMSRIRTNSKDKGGNMIQKLERIFDVDDSLYRIAESHKTHSTLMHHQSSNLSNISLFNNNEVDEQPHDNKIIPTRTRLLESARNHMRKNSSNDNHNNSGISNNPSQQVAEILQSPQSKSQFNQANALGFSQFIEINRDRGQTELTSASSPPNLPETLPLPSGQQHSSSSSMLQKIRLSSDGGSDRLSTPVINFNPTTPIQKWKRIMNDNQIDHLGAKFNTMLSPIAISRATEETPFSSQSQIKDTIKEDPTSASSLSALTPFSTSLKTLAQRNLRQIKEENSDTSKIEDNTSTTSIRRRKPNLLTSGVSPPQAILNDSISSAGIPKDSSQSQEKKKQRPTASPQQQPVQQNDQPDELQLDKQPSNPGISSQQLIYSENSMFIYNFDVMKEFEIYYPMNNAVRVITKFNAYRRKNQGYKAVMSKKKSLVRKRLAIFKQLQF